MKFRKQIGENKKVIIKDVVYTVPLAGPCKHGNEIFGLLESLGNFPEELSVLQGDIISLDTANL